MDVDPTPHPAGPARADRRTWFGLALVSLAIFMLSTELTALYLALPAIAADLAPSATQTLWILHVGEFVAAGTILTLGLVSVRIGPRRLLLIAVALYGLASLLAAFSSSPAMLIVARGLLGLATAGLSPAGYALVRRMFRDPGQFAFGLAVLNAAFLGGAAAGPALGGVLLSSFWWGSVFLVNVPPAVLVLLAGRLVLPAGSRDPSVRLDPFSVVVSVVMVLALVFGLQTLAADGLAPAPVAVAAVGVVLVAAFLRRQHRTRHPLLDVRLFGTRAFAALMGLLFVMLVAIGALDMLVSQYLQVVQGLAPLQAGLVLMAPAVAGVVGTLLAAGLQRWLRPGAALLVTLAATALVAGVSAGLLDVAGTAVVVASIALVTLLTSAAIALLVQLVITAVPEEQAGPAGAVQDVFASLGAATGIAAVGSLAFAVYRGGLEGRLPPQLAEPERAAVRENAGAAAAVADREAGPVGDELGAAVADAFTAGIQSGYVLAAVLAAALAAAAPRLLRGRAWS